MRIHSATLKATLFVALFILFMNAYNQRAFAQNYFIDNEGDIIWCTTPPYSFAPLSSIGYDHNHAVTVGIVGGLGINIHSARFRLAPFDQQSIVMRNPGVSASSVLSAVTNSLGSMYGINIEVPLQEQFSVGLRFLGGSNRTTFQTDANGSMEIALSTIGLETLGIFNIDEFFRAYAGISFSGLSETAYTLRSQLSSTFSMSEIPSASFMIVSPVFGFGVDLPISETTSPKSGRWIVTPELVGMIGINQMVENLSSQEFWSLAQIRLGFSVKYQWPSNVRP